MLLRLEAKAIDFARELNGCEFCIPGQKCEKFKYYLYCILNYLFSVVILCCNLCMKKGKGKELVLVDSQECFKKYGVSNGDLMTCPMGVEIQIVGMGKDSRLYAKFEGNIISPLESLNQEDLLRSGYKPKNFEKSMLHFASSAISFFAFTYIVTLCRQLSIKRRL